MESRGWLDGIEFRRVLIEAIDEALISFGEPVRRVFYHHFRVTYSTDINEVPERPELLVEFLNKLLGPGSRILECAILSRLCVKLGLDPKRFENMGLLEFLKRVERI